MPIASENFRFIQQFARDSAAIVLEPGKEYLVESRLTPLALQAGFATLDEFVSRLRTNPLQTMFHDQVIDALTTNETSFFRDFHPFETLRHQLIPLLATRRSAMRKLNIWSAAASTGQEAYSVAMILREHFPELRDWQMSILGTDLSPTVLSQAKEGAYSQLEVNRGSAGAAAVEVLHQGWREVGREG
jgi:chemotaxis protein methyltransferase CheR